jgi:hypothetical protein
MPSAHDVFSLMGDTYKWNATVDAFLSTHNSRRLMDFYQIFDQVPEGVDANWNSNPEEVPVRLPVGIVLDHHKWAVGFRQETIWSRFLHYLASMGSTHASYISLLELPRCYQSIVNHDSLLIIDSGASICITLHQSDFITYAASNMKIKDLSLSNTVAGEALMHLKVADLAGRVVNLDLCGYHIPEVEVCLLSS